MSKYLHPKSRTRIEEILDLRGEITMDEAVEIVEPHLICNYQEMRIQKAKQVVRSIMQSRKDSAGTRTCFATKRDGGESVYIDIDTCESVNDLRIVEQQLYEKAKGTVKSHRKARTNLRVLEGQVSMADIL